MGCTRRQIRSQTLTYQRAMAGYLFTAGHKKASTLAGLAAGEYIIEVRATSAAGDATDRVEFRVTS